MRHHLGDARFARAPCLQAARHDRRASARALQQVGQHLLVDHPLHLVRHARNRVDHLAAMRGPHSGRRADRVRDRLRPIGDVGLAQVVLRHVAGARREHRGDLVDELVVAHQRNLHPRGDGVAREVVLRGTEPAADDQRVGAREQIFDRGDDAIEVVADDAGARSCRCRRARAAHRSKPSSCRRSGRATARCRWRGPHSAWRRTLRGANSIAALPVDVAVADDLQAAHDCERGRGEQNRLLHAERGVGERQQHEADGAVLQERLVLAEALRGAGRCRDDRRRFGKARYRARARRSRAPATTRSRRLSASTARPPSTITLSATGSRNAPLRVAPSRRASQPSTLSLAVIANHSPTVSQPDPRRCTSQNVGTAVRIRATVIALAGVTSAL